VPELEKRTEVLKTFDESKQKNPQASLVELLIPELVPQLYVTFSRQRDFYETKKNLETDLEDVRKSQSMDRSELVLKIEVILQQLQELEEKVKALSVKQESQYTYCKGKIGEFELKEARMSEEMMAKDEQIKNLKVYSELNNNKTETESSEIKRKVDGMERTLMDALFKFVDKDENSKELQKYAYKRDLEFVKDEVNQCAKDFKVTKLSRDLAQLDQRLSQLYMNKLDVRELVQTSVKQSEEKTQRDTAVSVQNVNIKILAAEERVNSLEMV